VYGKVRRVSLKGIIRREYFGENEYMRYYKMWGEFLEEQQERGNKNCFELIKIQRGRPQIPGKV
jgi:hypothetical protein